MAELEVDLDKVHEIVHEHGHRVTWAEKVALTTALLAVMAAMASLMSTHESDKSILVSIKASDQWSFYQAKSIKSKLATDEAERIRYDKEKEEVKKEAETLSKESEEAVEIHEFFAYGVTLFQVATAIGAIAVLVKKKYYWYISLSLGVVGVGLVIKAVLLLHMAAK